MSKHDRKTRAISVLYFAEGAAYFCYSVWRTMISPLAFWNAGPLLGLLTMLFFFIMFVAGIYFMIKAWSLFKSSVEKPAKKGLLASLCAIPLWSLPAFFTLGLAISSLNAPPEEDARLGLHSIGLYFLQVGIVFAAIGAINLSSIVLIFLQRRKSSQKASLASEPPA